MKNWNELSITDKNDIIKVAVQNGITTLPEIRERYNEFAEGGDIVVPVDENVYAEGGSIHIKPENRGKFTALKERTGHSASWFKAHGTPAQRKMATFELNARKWKHGDGGHLYDGESEDTQQMYTGFDWWNRAPMTNYVDIAYEPIPDNAPKSKGTSLLDTPIIVQTTPTASSAATFGQYMPEYESTPKRELITLGATVAAPFLPTAAQYGLQAMNIAFTPSTWLNPVTGTKLLSPTVGTIADAGVQGAFAYEGLNGLWNQGRQGTLLSDPANTVMHGLEVLPMVGISARGAQYMYNKAKPFMNFLWNDGNVIQTKMPYNPNNFYREVSKEAIDDAISSRVVRTNGRFLGPYFAKGNSPLGTKDYIIEGYPNANKWVDADYYHRFVRGYDFPKGRNLFLEENTPFNTYAFPYYKSNVNTTPVSNFTYWQKHPLIGWRQHTFDNIAKVKRAYSAPKAEVMPVEGEIVTGDVPIITAENAASITPEQWTAAQDAAIARGDMAEAQRLRDLHSSLTDSATPGKYYRGTQTKRNSYLDRHVDEEVGEMNGIYLTKKPKYAKTYGDVEEFYLRSNNPLETEGSWTGVIDDATRAEIENAGYDAVVNNRFDTGFLNKLLRNSRDETITFNGKNLKLADAVTYDNNGVRIPFRDEG